MIEKLAITGRADWLEWRKPLLTASDIGAAAGVDGFKGPLDLYLEKLGLTPPKADTELMRRGRLFEPAAEAYLREELPGWRIARPNVFLRDSERRLGCTPDRLLEDPSEPEHLINCQSKVVSRPEFEKWEGEPPLSYQLQCVTENLLLGSRYTILACLVVSTYSAALEIYTIERHAEAEGRVVEVAADFWHRVENQLPPPADYRLDLDAVKKAYPPSKPAEPALDLTGDNRIGMLLEARERHKAAQKAAVDECEAIDAEIIEKLAGHTLALAEGWKITNRMTQRSEYTVKAASFPRLLVARTKEPA